MILTKSTLENISKTNVIVPNAEQLNLPEKVLQFGTGVLLRGLPDFLIDKANKQGIFNGRIAVVKSTSKGSTAEFDDQDSLYTLCIRGILDGKNVEEDVICSAISRVIVADEEWDAILSVGKSLELQLIVSNTTEVGIQFVEENIFQKPPLSFPAKLLAVLFERYKAIGKKIESKVIVIATELIPENGKKLESIILKLAAYNNLEHEFNAWLETNITFCNSLVDRIVPGKPDEETLSKLESRLGYEDNLLSMAEPYLLWAIEGDSKVSEMLSFSTVDSGVVITEDIEKYRELKVRLLNGTHTLSSGIAFLSGIQTVTNAMAQTDLRHYVSQVMVSEIVPAIPYKVDQEEAIAFSRKVIDRFSNPHIEHLWINITAQYTMKMKIRVLPVLLNFYKIENRVPRCIAFGFAAYLKFMSTAELKEKQYFGQIEGKEYPINDDQAAYFHGLKNEPTSSYVRLVLSDVSFWGTDLNTLPDFIQTVEQDYSSIDKIGIRAALTELNSLTQVPE
jgi:tagaturonate reductase